MAKVKCKKAKVKVEVKEEVIPKILIGVPILTWTHEFATSFLKFWTDIMTYQHKGRKFHVGFEFEYRKPVHMAEESLAQKAIDAGCTHLLLMDDDIYDIKAEDLIKLIDADKDVISGIMHTSGFPYSMCAFRRYDPNVKVADMPIQEGPARLYEVPPEQRTGIQEVDLIPFCFTLIKTDVFKKVKKPWFKCDTQAPTDSWFMDSIMEQGIKPYAHFGVLLNHRGIKAETVHLWRQIGTIEQQLASGPNIINLTQDEMRRHEMYMALKLKQAEEEFKKKMSENKIFYEQSGTGIAKPITKVGG